MKRSQQVIKDIRPGSIAEELGIEPGDILLSVNGQPVEDIFDYDFLCEDTALDLLIRSADGEEYLCEVEKDEDEELGLVFEEGIMDSYRSCRNKCIFCFIDQMPPGMRETLYFKDDDSRLSFIQGNYVTLTNMSDHDIDRIIRYNLMPINISVHSMDPQLRCMMLQNRFAGDALKKIDRLYEAGISMNGQIVLCPGINDGDSLSYTLQELLKYAPVMQSVSVVPVGLTKYREGLYPLEPVTKECALDTIRRVEEVQTESMALHGIHFVHASDELYLLAGMEMPEEDRYDGYLQWENGVGFIRLLKEEFREALAAEAPQTIHRKITAVTGRLIGPVIEELAAEAMEKFRGLAITVAAAENRFFGEKITVAGLVTGSDLKYCLEQLEPGEEILIPQNMLKNGENIFLDDISTDDISDWTGVPVRTVGSSGRELLDAFLGREEGTPEYHNDYELP